MRFPIPDAVPSPDLTPRPDAVFGPGSSPAYVPRVSTRRSLIAAPPLVALVGFVGGMVYHQANQVKSPMLARALITGAQQRLTRRLDADGIGRMLGYR